MNAGHTFLVLSCFDKYLLGCHLLESHDLMKHPLPPRTVYNTIGLSPEQVDVFIFGIGLILPTRAPEILHCMLQPPCPK